MNIEPFTTADISAFLLLAAAENWVAEAWEFEFLLSRFPQGCFVMRDDCGVAAGYVTALLHGQSGWIGNLVVAPLFRGKGFGEALFSKALDSLWAAGAQTVWLTASTAGMPLYEKHGFTQIDTINRWALRGRGCCGVTLGTLGRFGLAGSSCRLDALAWDDGRKALLDVTAGRGPVLQNESGFVVLQPGMAAVQLGPYAALDHFCAERLFDGITKAVTLGARIIVDVPALNQAAHQLFKRRQMKVVGSNVLMYAGRRADYRPELIYGLATMGSCG